MDENEKDGTNSLPEIPKPRDPRKCPMHNYWMRKGQCEICRLEQDKAHSAYLASRGITKQKIKIGKL
jgi:hypothetical protein